MPDNSRTRRKPPCPTQSATQSSLHEIDIQSHEVPEKPHYLFPYGAPTSKMQAHQCMLQAREEEDQKANENPCTTRLRSNPDDMHCDEFRPCTMISIGSAVPEVTPECFQAVRVEDEFKHGRPFLWFVKGQNTDEK